jgi:hypothetical protein
MMAPVLNDLAGELPEDAFVGKVNVEEYQSLAQLFSTPAIFDLQPQPCSDFRNGRNDHQSGHALSPFKGE